MLSNISLKNFKAFSYLNNLDIKPITILSGTNSCGKSSLLQSILLLKQNLESQSLNQTLLLNGRFVRLGAFENIIFDKKSENKVELKFSFNIRKDSFNKLYDYEKRQIPLILFLKDIFFLEEKILSDKFEYFLSYRVVLKTTADKRKKYKLKPVLIDEFELIIKTVNKEGEIISESFLKIDHKDHNSYDLCWKNIKDRHSVMQKGDLKK